MKMLMGITRGQVFEVVFWGTFAIIAYVLTFSFNQEVSGYVFGAAMWPRAIIALIFVSVCFQLYHDLCEKKIEAEQTQLEDRDKEEGATQRNWLKVGATLVLPLIYGTLLESVGYYCMTPFFLALFLYIGGERRWSRIVGVSLFIYILVTFLFTSVLYVGLPTGTLSPFYEISNWLLPLIR